MTLAPRAERRGEGGDGGHGGRGGCLSPFPRILPFFCGGVGAVFFGERKAPPQRQCRRYSLQMVIYALEIILHITGLGVASPEG